jgi:hypothetical protein
LGGDTLSELEKQIVQHIGDKYAESKAKFAALPQDYKLTRQFYEGRLSVLNELFRVIDKYK